MPSEESLVLWDKRPSPRQESAALASIFVTLGVCKTSVEVAGYLYLETAVLM